METKQKRAMKGEREHRRHLLEPLPGFLFFSWTGRPVLAFLAGFLSYTDNRSSPNPTSNRWSQYLPYSYVLSKQVAMKERILPGTTRLHRPLLNMSVNLNLNTKLESDCIAMQAKEGRHWDQAIFPLFPRLK